MRLLLLGLLVASAAGCSARRAIHTAEVDLLRDPGSADAWVAAAEAYRRGRQGDQAATALSRALQLDPEHEQAQALLRKGGRGELTDLERQALAHPDDDELWGDLGDAYVARGQRDVAVRHYLYALQLDPGDAEWIEKVGHLGGAADAAALLDPRTDYDDDEQVGDLADLYLAAGDTVQACVLYERANRLDPHDGEWIEKLHGSCDRLAVLDDAPGGIVSGVVPDSFVGPDEVYERPTADDIRRFGRPGAERPAGASGSAVLGPGVAALEAGDVERAVTWFERALEQDPTDQEAAYGLAVSSGRTLVEILAARAEGSTNDELWGDLGDAYLASGALPEARSAYERAGELDATDEEWARKLDLLRALDR